MPRSGTTLLAEYLNRVPGVSIGPETHFFPCVPRSWWRRPLTASKLAQLLDRLASFPPSQLSVDQIERARARLCTGAAVPADPVDALFCLVADDDSDAIVGEKTPGHLLYAERALQMDHRVRVILIVRDPRDVHRSLSGVPWNTASPCANGSRWRHYAQVAMRLQRDWPDRVRTVRFEDFVAEPVDWTNDLQMFLTGRVQPLGDRRPTFVLDDEPWKANALLDAQPDAALRWKQSPTPVDAQVAACAGPILGRFGYEYAALGLRTRLLVGVRRLPSVARQMLSSPTARRRPRTRQG